MRPLHGSIGTTTDVAFPARDVSPAEYENVYYQAQITEPAPV
jgi:hypothetical protein